MRTDYRIDRFQDTYFVIDGFDQLFAATKPDFTTALRGARRPAHPRPRRDGRGRSGGGAGAGVRVVLSDPSPASGSRARARGFSLAARRSASVRLGDRSSRGSKRVATAIVSAYICNIWFLQSHP